MQPGFIPMSLSSTGACPWAVLGTPALSAPSMVQPCPSAAQPGVRAASPGAP
ncbi:hypothetical protein [Comamonas aquatica]|uniref:hypothetical protein n=1 Tax=Comamonas aquatica TaxID=225991 RepID=UPI000A5F8470|nr:hypothetical protein [Comamonas aquatica]